MDALEFLKTKSRMCEYFFDKNKNEIWHKCTGCPLSIQNNGTGYLCKKFESEFPEKTVEIVEKWAKENPAKTRLSEFRRMFPNAGLLDGLPIACVKQYDKNFVCEIDNCPQCVKKYWNAEIE